MTSAFYMRKLSAFLFPHNLGGFYMFFSLGIILLSALLAASLCKKLRMPPLIGMLAVGIAIGPYALDLIDGSILDISPELRKIALIIILTRAGLSLDLAALKRVGRPAVLMCFVPACFEILGMALLAPLFLHIRLMEALILGAVIGAVSPAVIVPKMLKLSEKGYGADKGIPQLLLAGASVDDVFVIVMFSTFTGLEKNGTFSAFSLATIPVSVMLGVAAGLGIGCLLGKLFERIHIRDTEKLLLFLCAAFFLVAFEDTFGEKVPFSALIAVMSIGVAVQKIRPMAAERLSARFNKLWVAAEIFLFVLVGACVNLPYAAKAGISTVILILLVLLFRMAGVFVCLIKTNLNLKERLFCMLAYTPKATVQAAIGGIPLALGLDCGETVLTAAVIAILVTAPLGALLIDKTYKKLLDRS